MPQATDNLRILWHEYTALQHLQKNFNEEAGLISPKKLGYRPTEKEWSAIDYLWQEWDYAYAPDVGQTKKA